MTYYPVYLQLRDQPCVVIGGGKIAEGKVDGLLDGDARVKLISPELTPHLQGLVTENKIEYIAREYQPGDLTGAFMVICATDKAEINRQVWEEGSANRQLVNVVDDTPRCNFIAASILRKGDLTIAISTAGHAPVVAVRLKERLDREIGPEYERFLKLAAQLRGPIAKHIPDFETRKAVWYELIDSGILDVLARDDTPAAIDIISQVVGFPFEPT